MAEGSEDSEEECSPVGEENDSLMFEYNKALSSLSEKVKVGKFTSLTFQLNTTWEEATQDEKEIRIDKAMEGCKVVCEVIAPKAGDELLQSCVQLPDQETETISDELITLMQAHKYAPTRNLKIQILSLYAYQYSAKKLKMLHEPYERITDWQIKRARAHARECGPGFIVEKSTSHRNQYRNHCNESESPCANHCLKFGLSDPKNADFNETCSAHEHITRCHQCDSISTCINKIERAVKRLTFYSEEQQEDIVYDFEQAVKTVNQWKAHIMRTTNQERAKQDVLAMLDSSSRLVVMDWAMKFLQLRYREKQSDCMT